MCLDINIEALWVRVVDAVINGSATGVVIASFNSQALKLVDLFMSSISYNLNILLARVKGAAVVSSGSYD